MEPKLTPTFTRLVTALAVRLRDINPHTYIHTYNLDANANAVDQTVGYLSVGHNTVCNGTMVEEENHSA